MRNLLCITAVIALAGCTSARPMMAPSGARGFKIWCEMPSQCYERAAKTCPNGYNVEANEKDYWGLGDIDGNLIITCKSPGAAQLQPQAKTSNGSTPPAVQGNSWWNQQKPAQSTPTRYKCIDADGKPYTVTTPTSGCVVE